MAVIAREYARSSKGKGHRSRSTVDQHADNVAAEREFGPWSWGAAYVDTGSASRYATKNRDSFDRLLADLTTRDFGPPGSVLVLWEISRLSRDMGVGTKIVDLCESAGYLVHVTSEEHTYNASSYNDRHTLLAGINDAEREARRLSKRTLRGVQSNVNATNDEGESAARPHGTVPFGYQRDYGLVDGRVRPVKQYPHPVEADIVRELYRRVLNGDSLRSIAADFEKRGYKGQRGSSFSPSALRKMLIKDAYRGYRSHLDSKTGNTTAVKASWPALVDDVTWHAVQKLIKDPTRRTRTSTAVRHEFTMTIRCDVCGGPMAAEQRSNGRPAIYVCHQKSCVTIPKDDVDAIVTKDIVDFLGRPDVSSRLTPPAVDTYSARLVDLRAQLEAFENADPETPDEARILGRKAKKLRESIGELEAKQRELTTPTRLSVLFPEDTGSVLKRWKALPVTVRREIASILLQPRLLGTVRIARAAAPGRSTPASERVRFCTDD